MHFSIYARLLDLLWEHLDDEDQFRQLAHDAVERYITHRRGKMEEGLILYVRIMQTSTFLGGLLDMAYRRDERVSFIK